MYISPKSRRVLNMLVASYLARGGKVTLCKAPRRRGNPRFASYVDFLLGRYR
jgi:hypothetical protein